MSTPKNRECGRIDDSKVFLNEDGTIFMWKRIKVQTWNDFEKKFDDAPSLTRFEKVTPEDLNCIRHMTDKILVCKKIQSEDNLQDTETIFEMDLDYNRPTDEQYRFQYFYRCKKSGRIMVKDFRSGCAFSAGVNSVYVTKGKTRKLPENSLISKTRPIYVLNSSTGELEERLPESN